MNTIQIDITKAVQFLTPGTIEALEPQVKAAHASLENSTCPGNDFLGWLHLPSSTTADFLADLKATAATLRENCDTIVVAGIGGSYLGARAIIEALSNSFQWLLGDKKNPVILFAGNNISEDYLSELCDYLRGRDFGVINISKSGTTTETALAFRLLKRQCEQQRGKDMARRVIVAITDARRGAARTTADKEGYKSFVIPDNVGGRFSVLTPVGLLPIACAGFDIDQLIAGAQDMEKACGPDTPLGQNPAALYAACRNALYAAGKKVEILVNFQPKLHYMNEWWKQLYGESEGKDGKGIFPAAVDFTTDLHSMGQWIQEGERTIFETVISVETPEHELHFPTRTSTGSTSWPANASTKSTRWPSSARSWPMWTAECPTCASASPAWTPTTSASSSTSSSWAAASAAISLVSTPSTSQALRRTSATCSRCSTSRAMKPKARLSAPA